MTLIKNCGLKTTHAVDVAIQTGASFIGFVHHPASPRHIDLQQMAALAKHVGERAEHVAVLVNPHDTLIDDILAHYTPDYFQLHGVTSPARIADIRSRTHARIITAIAVHETSDIKGNYDLTYESDYVLFDAKHKDLPGGTGHSFNWELLKNIHLDRPWFLAGGLRPENVAEAIALTKAPMVDVSTGIESSPGEKSVEKIAAFNKAVLDTRA